MNPMERLRAVLREELTEIQEEMIRSDSDENHYMEGKEFALVSTIAKIDELDPTAKP